CAWAGLTEAVVSEVAASAALFAWVFCKSAIAAFCCCGVSVLSISFLDVEKDGGDGAAEVNDSEHPATMSTGKARNSNDARFDRGRSMDRTIARQLELHAPCYIA